MKWMKAFGLVGMLVGGMIAALWSLGRRLPAEHRAVASGVVGANPDRVWELVIDVSSQQSWRMGLVGMQSGALDITGWGPCWTEHWPSTRQLGFCVMEEQVGMRRVVRMEDHEHAYRGTMTYDLAPDAGGTRVTITEEAIVASPFRRAYGHYVLRDRTEARQYLADLQAEAARSR